LKAAATAAANGQQHTCLPVAACCCVAVGPQTEICVRKTIIIVIIVIDNALRWQQALSEGIQGLKATDRNRHILQPGERHDAPTCVFIGFI
jgi:hypothetical protein